jgi:glycosidase
MNYKKLNKVILLLLLIISFGAFSQRKTEKMNNEVIYHIFQRSFYDSNGDMHGDFNGLKEKLDYLQDLGITSILLTPICESPFYHNYFSDDFEKTDPKYGTRQEFTNLVKAIHQRGMKIYLDMETQYVTEDHIWFKDSYNNPKSAYSEYILYNDAANTKPEGTIYGITELAGYNGVVKKITTVNLYSKKVKDYNYELFKSFVDPNNDGNFDDGVDGFRLDHMMDDLDGKGKLVNLFADFWSPLLIKLKNINPKLKIIAEQANWSSYGHEYFEKGRVDRVFAFNLQKAIASFDKNKIINEADSTLNLTPKGSQQVVFLENHDMVRFASAVGKDPGKLKVGAAVNLLLSELPSVYYGQELGMTGSGGFSKFGITDGNDIPQREAFEWYKSDSGKGMALWYKDTGPWWDQTSLVPNDGVSLEEEKADPNSLWHFYRTMLHLRKTNEALALGKYQNLINNNDHVFSFRRYINNQAVMVIINLSGADQNVKISSGKAAKNVATNKLYGNSKLITNASGTWSVSLSPYAIEVIEIK